MILEGERPDPKTNMSSGIVLLDNRSGMALFANTGR